MAAGGAEALRCQYFSLGHVIFHWVRVFIVIPTLWIELIYWTLDEHQGSKLVGNKSFIEMLHQQMIRSSVRYDVN